MFQYNVISIDYEKLYYLETGTEDSRVFTMIIDDKKTPSDS